MPPNTCDRCRGRELKITAEDTSIISHPWFTAILDERDHQDAKWGTPQCNTLPEWITILMEEVGELAAAILGHCFGAENLRNNWSASAYLPWLLKHRACISRASYSTEGGVPRVTARPNAFAAGTNCSTGRSSRVHRDTF